MASRKEGTDLQAVQKIKTRDELTSLKVELKEKMKTEEGHTIETYEILKKKGSITRACIHGLLDLSTLFAWEFIGTPIEGALSENRYFSLKITFDKNDQILNMEIQ